MDNKVDKPFEPPITLSANGRAWRIDSVRDAVELLSSTDWPGKRGPRHRDALETGLKVIDGHRVVSEARREFLLAADEAGVSILA